MGSRQSVSVADTIYVQIPAYRDLELWPTIRDLRSKAAHPDRLRVAILWQREPGSRAPSDVATLAGVEIFEVDASDSQGPNWARRKLRRNWNGERFTLMLDSHHRFVAGWDEKLISIYRTAVENTNRLPVLTCYLPPYWPGVPVQLSPAVPLRLLPYRWESGVLTRLAGWPIPFASQLRAPVRAQFASFHFTFATGELNQRIELELLDDIYFFGDEILLSLILQSVGFELFHPHEVIGWHAYDRAQRVPHWSSAPVWSARHERSINLLRSAILQAGESRSPITSDAVEYVETQMMGRLLEVAGS